MRILYALMGTVRERLLRHPRPSDPSPLTLRLETASVPVPIPADITDPLDQEISRLWADFQRGNGSATWSAFVATLTARNARLDTEIAARSRDLAAYLPGSEFKP